MNETCRPAAVLRPDRTLAAFAARPNVAPGRPIGPVCVVSKRDPETGAFRPVRRFNRWLKVGRDENGRPLPQPNGPPFVDLPA